MPYNYLDNLLQAADLQVVFLVTLIEKFIPILPSYIMLPAIGMSATSGTDLIMRWLVATLGSLGGALAWYMIGSMIGPKRIRHFVAQYGKWVFLKLSLYDKMSASYKQNPFSITAIGQFLPAVRIFQALPAGVLRLPLLPFLAATALGSQGWIISLTTAGYFLHLAGFTPTETGLGLFVALLTIEAAVFFIGHLIYKHKIKNKLSLDNQVAR